VYYPHSSLFCYVISPRTHHEHSSSRFFFVPHAGVLLYTNGDLPLANAETSRCKVLLLEVKKDKVADPATGPQYIVHTKIFSLSKYAHMQCIGTPYTDRQAPTNARHALPVRRRPVNAHTAQ